MQGVYSYVKHYQNFVVVARSLMDNSCTLEVILIECTIVLCWFYNILRECAIVLRWF